MYRSINNIHTRYKSTCKCPRWVFGTVVLLKLQTRPKCWAQFCDIWDTHWLITDLWFYKPKLNGFATNKQSNHCHNHVSMILATSVLKLWWCLMSIMAAFSWNQCRFYDNLHIYGAPCIRSCLQFLQRWELILQS